MKNEKEQLNRKSSPILHLERIAILSAGSELSTGFISEVGKNCTVLCSCLDCNPIEAILFSVIFNLNLTYKTVGLDQMAKWLNCNPVTLVRYVNQLEEMRKKKIIRKIHAEDTDPDSSTRSVAGICYCINPEVFEALKDGRKFTFSAAKISDTYSLVKSFAGLIRQCHEKLITPDEMWHEIEIIQSECRSMDFLKAVKRFSLSKCERILFYDLCDEYLLGRSQTDFFSLVARTGSSERFQLLLRTTIMNGTSELVSRGLVELAEGMFRSDKNICLTSKSINLLLKDNPELILGNEETEMPGIIPAHTITEKRLCFDPAEQGKLDHLHNILLERNYRKMARRMENSGMKKGVAILFYGPPGTGKTESVYQLALQTGRDIQMVTISETKSKWYGESEKRIKGVFDQYRRLVEKADRTPILLLNEADAIISSRKTLQDNQLDQTENAIQNILLQELEDLDGILIATTNMIRNFDKAFDRRFLYKIRFQMPSPEIRSGIWREKIPGLPKDYSIKLAGSFNLSGGQIDNIARKYLTHHILYSKKASVDQIVEWCNEENLETEIKKIGFTF